MEIRGAGVPDRHATAAGVFEVKIGGGEGGFAENCFHNFSAAMRFEFGIRSSSEKFKLFGEAADGPGETASPGAERGVTLLRIWAAIVAVVRVENAFVGGASAKVVGVARCAIVDREFGGIDRVLD